LKSLRIGSILALVLLSLTALLPFAYAQNDVLHFRRADAPAGAPGTYAKMMDYGPVPATETSVTLSPGESIYWYSYPVGAGNPVASGTYVVYFHYTVTTSTTVTVRVVYYSPTWTESHIPGIGESTVTLDPRYTSATVTWTGVGSWTLPKDYRLAVYIKVPSGEPSVRIRFDGTNYDGVLVTPAFAGPIPELPLVFLPAVIIGMALIAVRLKPDLLRTRR